ncbi:MAG TPA: hypothetical protein DEO94_05820 [Cyanobacteria bacterium UBA11991]|nr:hypothetical protein [Cyanobacteriota bacterium]MDY6382980.1 hypothetical protein [Cyanobacteriota bacterium]HCB11633.1 hypothetical protein [Cyanobacteria bacterium UBA11991]
MRNKLFAIILAILFTAQMTLAAPFSGNAKTKRIPAGTILELKMLNTVDTSVSTAGSDFSAMLITDQKADDNDDVILPMGSVVRGSVKAIKPARRLSKGAVLYLDFDHVVTPNGRQIPLSLVVAGAQNTTFDGGITTTKGYKDAWRKTVTKSADITRNAVNWGEDVTDNGFKYVVVPAAAVGGAFGTSGYFVYGSVADAIKKGKNVQIYKGDILNVQLTEPIDVPVY